MGDDDKTRISPSLGHTGVGTQLSGIYELDERIASGGMGEVYRGHNIQTGDQKFEVTAIQYTTVAGKFQVKEIRLGGTRTKLVFLQ